ncbi:phage late control D family protein [Parasegetibacter sp. NRK P23]|uniref:phage late control D family protein n=1 Tax=Parasegetibacter sp. NRK P23 TaxID=2942999 RepID=UPI00204352D3|nr:hypothetical protein [Parasegetibacter sp. NRK P23]MCM5528971.1 hypothetical protein [Parasegetibacter sp. NRK P23]
MNLPKPEYSIIYNQRDISMDISEQVLGISYTDKVAGESDTIEISVEDTDGRWQNDWYPKKGDTIQAFIRENNRQLDCGVFEIDETALSSSTGGDIFTIRGLAAGIKAPVRTKKSYAHHNKSLREIANTIAAESGLTLLGVVPDITLGVSNQYRETAVGYLNRIGSEYGCVFSIRGDKLVFTHYLEIENSNSVLSIPKSKSITVNLTDQTNKTFKAARVRHNKPNDKEVQEFTSTEQNPTGSSDTLEIRVKAENRQQAEAKAKYALSKNNTKTVSGDVNMPGNILLVSGSNFELTGFGFMSGIFHIIESTHTIDRSGAYTTSATIKRVKTIDSTKFKSV